GDAARLVSMGAVYPNGLANTPTYSIPARASILTGAPPESNGVLSNEYTGAVGVDSIVRAAREAGFKILCSGDASVEMLFREYIDECALVEEGGGQGALALAEGLNLLRRYSGMGHSVFLWISVNDVDMIGHLAGGAGAPEYNSTAANVVKLTLNAVEALAGEDALVVILSDHGFKRGGHHGGPEPEVRRVFTLLVGPGVRPGVYTTGYTHNDIAPTVAMLMGLRLPAQSIGRPLEEGFNLPSDRVEAYRKASLEQAWRVVGALSEASGVRVPEGADPLEAYGVITGRLYSEGMGFRLAAALALALLVPAGLYASLKGCSRLNCGAPAGLGRADPLQGGPTKGPRASAHGNDPSGGLKPRLRSTLLRQLRLNSAIPPTRLGEGFQVLPLPHQSLLHNARGDGAGHRNHPRALHRRPLRAKGIEETAEQTTANY
ncbi:MAG: alkaline phosphatase family protein, partial [Thermofilaceae archaeon]